MSISSKFRHFFRAEDGLVTVEWVALAAGMVVAAIAVSFILMKNLSSEATSVPAGITSTVTAVYGSNGALL